jgi:hypothetical protein
MFECLLYFECVAAKYHAIIEIVLEKYLLIRNVTATTESGECDIN